MICKIRNTAARPVSLRLNSGRTVHLSPSLEHPTAQFDHRRRQPWLLG
jgi:hypothetical protein